MLMSLLNYSNRLLPEPQPRNLECLGTATLYRPLQPLKNPKPYIEAVLAVEKIRERP